MALQGQLEKFKQQQQRCQTTLTNIAAKAGSSKPVSSSTSQRRVPTPKPTIKFSNDTERLQHISSVRNSAVGKQMKSVIDLLLKEQQALTPQQINEACYVDINGNKALFESLRKNPKVKYDGRTFKYKPKHDLEDKSQLLKLIRERENGIAVIDLKDAYPSVMDDLKALKAAGQIWLLSNFDSQEEDIAYPNDPKVHIKVDVDLKQLFRKTELPLDMLDIESYLSKNGFKPATDTAKRRASAQVQGISTKPKAKKKKHEISSRTKLTNSHLPELFQNLKK